MAAGSAEHEPAVGTGISGAHRLAIAIIVLLIMSFLAGVGATVWRMYAEVGERAEEQAASAAQVMSANARWVLQTAQQILLRVDDLLDDDLNPPDADAVAGVAEAVNTLPGGAKVYVVAADGGTRMTTDGGFRDIDIRDRDYFQAPQGGARWYVSGLLVSRLDGEQIFVVSRRLTRDGRFAGVGMISFDSRLLLHEVWESLGLDDLSPVSLVRDDGQLVARYPLPPGPLDLSGQRLFTEYLKAAPAGTYRTVSLADGVPRIAGYQRIEGTNMIALGSVSEARAFERFNTGLAAALVLLVPVVLAFGAMGWWLDRLLRGDAKRRDDLARAVESNQLLFREIHHRVKNNLQAVSSLVSMQAMPAEAKLDMTRRIAAMVAVHEHIYRNDQFTQVEAGSYIPVIVDNLVGSYGGPVSVSYAVEALTVDREQAMPIGLIVNEVVSNALKYAFADGRQGRIDVALARREGEHAVLRIADNGPGFDPLEKRKGMGSRLIAGLSAQLDAEFSYTQENGTVFTLDFPLTGRHGS